MLGGAASATVSPVPAGISRVRVLVLSSTLVREAHTRCMNPATRMYCDNIFVFVAAILHDTQRSKYCPSMV
jgi:hypothetical protein